MDVILYSKLAKQGKLIDERTLYESTNLYNPALQTPETISPHYYVNGVPNSSTQYDDSYNCTALFELEPNTKYTIGLVPAFVENQNQIVKPWHNAGAGIFFYDAEGTYISGNNNGTFTTPNNTKYARFNYYIHNGYAVTLSQLNTRCVIVKGESLPDHYIKYSEDTVKETLDLLLGNHSFYDSPNLYDPALQTADTISPHYYVNGEPYSSTQFDDSYHCTALFDIEPNTKYTIGLVPALGTIVKPWNAAGYGIFFYKEDGTYISGATSGTFTTPNNAKKARFNFYWNRGYTVSLGELNSRCMLVKGDTLPSVYEEKGSKLTSDLQTKIDSIYRIGTEYKFDDGNLMLSYGYNDQYDAVVVLNEGRANGLFDFASLKLKQKGKPLSECAAENLTTVWTSGTDMHGPFQFNAKQNADGYKYDATTPGWVGGNHTLDQLGTGFETATSKYVYYFADGKPVSSGYGVCSKFEIRWANDVQAYNTVKEGGGGRACLTEYHDMVFDGMQFNEMVKLVAIEDIDMRLYYGFQFVSFGSGNAYPKIRFIDGTNRGEYTGNATSGNKVTSGMEAYGDNHKAIVMLDTTIDLGKRNLVASVYETSGAFTSSSKGYMRALTQDCNWDEGDAYYMKGSFRFCPVVSASS